MKMSEITFCMCKKEFNGTCELWKLHLNITGTSFVQTTGFPASQIHMASSQNSPVILGAHIGNYPPYTPKWMLVTMLLTEPRPLMAL